MEEAQKRVSEVDTTLVPDYLRKVLDSIRQSLEAQNERNAEDVLMYSTIVQNYCTSH